MASGQARKGFDLDLMDGQAREDALARLLMKTRVEVKSDERCRETGHVFVEFSSRGKPSGISTTTADWWAIEFNKDCWLFLPTARLKEIARLAWQRGMKAKGGDQDTSEGVLVPLEWLITY